MNPYENCPDPRRSKKRDTPSQISFFSIVFVLGRFEVLKHGQTVHRTEVIKELGKSESTNMKI